MTVDRVIERDLISGLELSHEIQPSDVGHTWITYDSGMVKSSDIGKIVRARGSEIIVEDPSPLRKKWQKLRRTIRNWLMRGEL